MPSAVLKLGRCWFHDRQEAFEMETWKEMDKPEFSSSERISKILTMAEVLAGGWPGELSRDTFEGIDFDTLVARVKDYQERIYPFPFSSDHRKTEYKIVGAKVHRVCDPVQDSKLVSTARMLGGGRIGMGEFERMGRLAVQVIDHYAQTRLAKFLFRLPKARENIDTISKGGAAINVVEYLDIEVLKGVENVLLEIYDELEEGGLFDDDLVTKKLLSIVESARTK
jgi:hypothetical protein